jgi:Domain of unknown function (DUF6484)
MKRQGLEVTVDDRSVVEELLLSVNSPAEPSAIGGAVIGEIAGFTDDGVPLVDFPDGQSIVALSRRDTGKRVLLLFENGDPRKPIIMGLLQSTTAAQAEVDDEELIITGQKQVTLRCGKASITLTRAGKILIRGEYVLSRATGANQVQGASVELN